MTSNKGRGVFANRNLKLGELLIVEKPIAYVWANIEELGLTFPASEYHFDFEF